MDVREANGHHLHILRLLSKRDLKQLVPKFFSTLASMKLEIEKKYRFKCPSKLKGLVVKSNGIDIPLTNPAFFAGMFLGTIY